MKAEIDVGNVLLSDLPKTSGRSRSFLERTGVSRLFCSLLAGLGVFGGISVLFAGLICLSIHLMLLPETLFDRAGTFLLIIAIPMMLVGSIFLDEIGSRR